MKKTVLMIVCVLMMSGGIIKSQDEPAVRPDEEKPMAELLRDFEQEAYTTFLGYHIPYGVWGLIYVRSMAVSYVMNRYNLHGYAIGSDQSTIRMTREDVANVAVETVYAGYVYGQEAAVETATVQTVGTVVHNKLRQINADEEVLNVSKIVVRKIPVFGNDIVDSFIPADDQFLKWSINKGFEAAAQTLATVALAGAVAAIRVGIKVVYDDNGLRIESTVS